VVPAWGTMGGLAVHPLVVAASIAGPTSPLSARFWLTTLGAFGVFIVVFAETGLLIGVFLPGDSLLFTAGVLCSTHLGPGPGLSLPWVLIAAAAGAVAGAQVGFVAGRRGGRAVLARAPGVRLGMLRAEGLFARYGYGKAIVLARFIPVVRTVINPLAGILTVPNKVFVRWQVVGGVAWSLGVTVTGYALGASIPGVDHYLLPAIAAVIGLSLLPAGYELARARRRTR
jgi:membrane-associated protein